MPDASLISPYKKQVLFSGTTTSSVTATGEFSLTTFSNTLLKLSCTAASGTSPTLNVYLQGTPDRGTTWVDVVSFTQLAASSANSYYANLGSGGDSKVSAAFTSGSATTATVSAPLISRQYRVIASVAGTGPSFTWSLAALQA